MTTRRKRILWLTAGMLCLCVAVFAYRQRGVPKSRVEQLDMNAFRSIEFPDWVPLDPIALPSRNLQELDVSEYPNLRVLWCRFNQLSSLDLSANTKLAYLDCDNNQLTSLGLSANTNLTYLFCSDNQLAALDLSANPKLNTVDCQNNPLTEIIVADTNNLPASFLYPPGTTIREPNPITPPHAPDSQKATP
jgi:hypothetical protein